MPRRQCVRPGACVWLDFRLEAEKDLFFVFSLTLAIANLNKTLDKN